MQSRENNAAIKWSAGIIAALIAAGVAGLIRMGNAVARIEASIEYTARQLSQLDQDMHDLTRRVNEHLQK